MKKFAFPYLLATILTVLSSCKKNHPKACISPLPLEILNAEGYTTYRVEIMKEINLVNCTKNGFKFEWHLVDEYNQTDNIVSTDKDFSYTFNNRGDFHIWLYSFDKRGKKNTSDVIYFDVFRYGGIFSLLISKIPSKDSNGNNWDQDNTGPDIKLRYRINGNSNWCYTKSYFDSLSLNINENNFKPILYDNNIQNINSDDCHSLDLFYSQVEFQLLEFDENNDLNFIIMNTWSIDLKNSERMKSDDGKTYIVIADGNNSDYDIRLLQ